MALGPCRFWREDNGSCRSYPRKALTRSTLWFYVLFACALALRLAFVLTHDNYLGVDGGAYLLGRNAVLGDEPTGAGFPRPPLAPGWQLVPFTAALGDDVGFKVWSALAAMAPIAATYLLAGLFLGPIARLAATAFVAFDPLHSEMMVTGALPLEGFALIMVGIWAMVVLDRNESGKRHAVILVGVVPLTLFVNQTSGGLIAIVLPFWGLAVLMFWWLSVQASDRGRWLALVLGPFFRAQHWFLVLGGLLALSALPWYLDVAPNSEILHYPGPWLYLASFSDGAWFLLFVGVPLGLFLVHKGSREVKALGALILLLAGIGIWWSTDETIINLFYRAKYLLTPFLYIGAAWAVGYGLSAAKPRVVGKGPEEEEGTPPERWPVRRLAAALVLIPLLGAWVYASNWSFNNQADYSDMVTVETAAALDLVRGNSEGIVSNAFTMSLWVSALNKVPSPHPWTWEPPRAYTATDQDVRCVLGWVENCGGRTAAARLGVSHVLVDDRFPYYNERAPGNYGAPDDQWAVTAAVSWLDLVYAEGTTRMWRIQ